MGRQILGLLTFGIVAVGGLSASSYYSCCGDPCCDPCPSCCCCGSFEVGGQAIYLRPSSCDHDFVIKDNRPIPTNGTQQDLEDIAAQLPSGKSKGIDIDYEWGFRVSAGYVCDCLDVRGEYTYHHPNQCFTVFGSETLGLWQTYMHPRYTRNFDIAGMAGILSPLFSQSSVETEAKATGCVKLDYDAADLQFGYRTMKGCNLWLRAYAGLHFMNLDYRMKVHYQGVVAGPPLTTNALPGNLGTVDEQVCWHKQTWGIGPLFGIDARYAVACGFGVAGHLGAAILAGETDGKYFESDLIDFQTAPPTDINEEANVKHGSRNILFPYLRASLGVNYLWCCDCFKVLVEVGYEFNSYINTVGHFRFNDERGTGMANCYSYNLDGLYISVKATI